MLITGEARFMNYFLLLLGDALICSARTEAWIPSQSFLFVVLVIGAFLTGGVALSVLTFYEDHYWGDKQYRKELRLDSSRRN